MEREVPKRGPHVAFVYVHRSSIEIGGESIDFGATHLVQIFLLFSDRVLCSHALKYIGRGLGGGRRERSDERQHV